MHQCSHEPHPQSVDSHLAERATENLPSVGFPSLESRSENIHQASPNMNVIQELSLWPTDEGAVHPLPGRRAADSPGP